MIESLFFDMGNTLLDFHQGFTDDEKDTLGLEHMAAWLRGRGVEIDAGELQRDFFAPWSSVFPRRHTELREFAVEPYLRACLEPRGVRLSDAECIELMGELFRAFSDGVVLEDGLETTLRELKARGCAIGVISNSNLPGAVMEACFRRVGLDACLDGYVFSYEVVHRKPRPEIFRAALDRLGAGAETSLMVGDRLDADVAGAQAVGMKAAWLNRRGAVNTTAVRPDLEISRIAEIAGHLARQVFD